MKQFSCWSVLAALLVSGCAAPPTNAAPKAKTPKLANAIKAESTDVAFGGQGAGNGKFFQIADIAFDKSGNLYVLDGLFYDKKEKKWLGNDLVQKFDGDGNFLSQFSVANPALGDNDAPNRMAIDDAGRFYISKTDASAVEIYAPDGKLLQSVAVPGASGVARWNGKIAVIGGTSVVVNRKRVMLGGDEVLILGGDGAIEKRVKLERALGKVSSLATDKTGNFYILADVNQLYKFDAQGKLLDAVGSTSKPRAYDGSQLNESLAIDSKGDVVAGSWGDALRFDSNFETVTRRPGRFNIANGWGTRTRFAFDAQDRLWVASTAVNNPKSDPKNKYYADKPAVLRLASDYYDPKNPQVSVSSTLLIGFAPEIITSVPYQVAYKPGPFPLTLDLPAAQRRLKTIEVRWRLLDAYGTSVDKGDFQLPLTDGEEVKKSFTVSPPRNGWYAVVTDYVHDGKSLQTGAEFIGVAPQYPGMDAPISDDPKIIGPKGGWEDAPRQVFSGLPFMRLHPGKGLDKLDEDIKSANAAGANFIVQLTSESDVQPDKVRALVTRFKGRIPIYEIINEPNISLKGGLNRYNEIWKTVAPLIKGIDPNAKLMGPATVNIDLKWIEGFFAESAPLVDMVSVHDYEGHTTYDPTHWDWKIGELRKLMAKYGLADKPLYQTERADGAVYRSNFEGLRQAYNLTFHYDLLQSLGIAPEHNQHYYLNEGGYNSVPTYVWSKSGPHPAALAMRTRTALTQGREYLGKIDFGPNGDKFLFGLRYGPKNGDGGLIVIRNLGALQGPLELKISGNPEIIDAWGNVSALANGTLAVGQMPTYLRVAAGASVGFPKWDWGRNFAKEAKFTYSAESSNPAAPERKDKAGTEALEATPEDAVLNPNNLLPQLLTSDPMQLLTNGLLETHHGGDPLGGTGSSPRFNGELPSFPQNLDITFPNARPISRIAVFSEQGDNGFCALLDYDVQAMVKGAWKTVAQVRDPIPASTPAEAFNTTTLTWMLDPNRSFVAFDAPVTTDKLRLVIRRVSYGFAPDDGVRGWSQIIKPQLMLKEIEIY